MDKLKAFIALKEGKRITHQLFMAGEYLQIREGTVDTTIEQVVDELGNTVNLSIFSRRGFDDGWSIFTPKEEQPFTIN